MVFITVQPFLDSFNTYASVEPLDSRLHLSRTFTFIRMTKEWNYLISFTLLRYYFLTFVICCDSKIFFITIYWIWANPYIPLFRTRCILFYFILHFNINLDRRQFIISSYTSSSIAEWDFLVVSLSFSFPLLTFSSSVDNVENILDRRRAITIILENDIFTAGSELPTYRRS